MTNEQNEAIDRAAKLARDARDEAVATSAANKVGSPDRATALRLNEDWLAAASAARFYEREHAALVAGRGTP